MNDQERVQQFIREHQLGGGPSEWVHDLQSELGEVSKETLKATDYGEKDVEDIDFDDSMELEVGDLYFSLLGLANALNIDVTRALERVLEKYAGRVELTGDAGSGN